MLRTRFMSYVELRDTLRIAALLASMITTSSAGAAPADSSAAPAFPSDATPPPAPAGMLQSDTTPPPAVPSDLPDQVSSIQSILTRLQRTGFNGYIQGRSASTENTDPSNTFFVRRARVGIRHTITDGRFVLSLDGGQNVVTIKDAYFDWFATKDRGQRKGATLRIGQFLRPFGYEVERSSADREFMERPLAWLTLFPGNRDVGADLSYGITPALLVNAAVVNGGGSSSAGMPFRDPDDHKDVMTRIRYSLFSPRIELSASAYVGEQTIPGTAAVPAQLGFVDSNGNGVKDTGEETVVSVPAKAAVPAITSDRNRYGVGTIVSNLAGGTLRAEALWGDDITTNLGSGPSRTEAPVFAWYAQYVHSIVGPFSGGFRYDCSDPDTDDTVRLGGDGETDTFATVAMVQTGESIRWTLEWDHVRTWNYNRTAVESNLLDSDQFTFQGQVRF